MVEINLTYQPHLHTHATHVQSGQTLWTDAPVDNNGKGESFSPTDLLATSLGACMLTIMGMIADREKIDLKGTQVKVIKEMTATPPRRVGKLTVTFQIPASANVSPVQQQKLINAAHTCPVHRSLHPEIEVVTTFSWG